MLELTNSADGGRRNESVSSSHAGLAASHDRDDDGNDASSAAAVAAVADDDDNGYRDVEQPSKNEVEKDIISSQQQDHRHHLLSSSTSSPSKLTILHKKLILLLPLLLILYLLSDNEYYTLTPNKRHHLAFVTALARHPPSLRIFRIVSEGAFLLLCTAFALWVWEGAANGASGANGGAGSNDDDERHGRRYSDFIAPEDNSESKEGENNTFSNEASNEKSSSSSSSSLSITPEIVGKLLFAPAPNSITSNDALKFYKHHHRAILRKRRKKKRQQRSGSNSESSDSLGGEIDHIEKSSLTEENDKKTLSTEQQQQSEHHQSQTIVPLPPSHTTVLGAALDILTVTCIFLILFTLSSSEGGRYIDQRSNANANSANAAFQESTGMKFIAQFAAPLFPLCLFLLSSAAIVFPWRARRELFHIVSLTVGAPFYDVTFRDGFVGDVLTSTVRPLQDLAFTVFFLPFGLRAFWDSEELYTEDARDVPWERSWILHTVVLPACTLSPLWWRFLQNLRQCYDAKQRWPFLGNATKYLAAASVAIFGVFDPSVKSNPLWVSCFFGATLYQIWWDVFMDWGLLERKNEHDYGHSRYGSYGSHNRSSSSSSWFGWWPYTLRSKRLYRRKWVYFLIFALNFCLRFVGMITLIPPVYLSRTTGLIVNTYNDPDFQLFAGSLIACLEIFRRTVWALLRLEWEVIKTAPKAKAIRGNDKHAMEAEKEDDEVGDALKREEMKPMSISSSGQNGRRSWPLVAATKARSLRSLSDMSNLNDIQILSELCVWATVFSGIAIIAAAHREVL